MNFKIVYSLREKKNKKYNDLFLKSLIGKTSIEKERSGER